MIRETILCVDDEDLNLELFRANFENEYHVITATSGEQALDILQKRSDINIIVSDVKMPNMNGFEFIRRVKIMAPNTICIFLSAFLITDFNKPLDSKHIYRYLNKPWRKFEMNRVIQEAIESYKSLEKA